MKLELHNFLIDKGFEMVNPTKMVKYELYTTIKKRKICIIRCYFIGNGMYVYNFKSMGCYGLYFKTPNIYQTSVDNMKNIISRLIKKHIRLAKIENILED